MLKLAYLPNLIADSNQIFLNKKDDRRRRHETGTASLTNEQSAKHCVMACKLLCKPMANAVGKGEFRPPHLQNCLTDFDETRTLELFLEDHPPCKISFRSSDVAGPNLPGFFLFW